MSALLGKTNIIRSLLTVSKAQNLLRQHVRAERLRRGFTQEGLANRAGVSLSTLRKFKQRGLISLAGFLKIVMVLDALADVVDALQPPEQAYRSIDDVLAERPPTTRKHGWRT